MDDLIELMKWMLGQPSTAKDLASTLSQKIRTTKLDRRERALAYLIESFTGAQEAMSHDRARMIWEVADQLCKRTRSSEVKVACNRTMARMTFVLNEDEIMTTECVACGEKVLPGGHGKHSCNPAKIAHKNAAMMRDDTVLET